MKKTPTKNSEQCQDELTLLEALARIEEQSEASKLSDDFMKQVANEVKLLTKNLGITERQVVLFSICLGKHERTDMEELAQHLGVSNIRIWSYANDITELIKKRLLLNCGTKRREKYCVPISVINGLKNNEVSKPPMKTKLNSNTLFEELERVFDSFDGEYMETDELEEELNPLINNNQQVLFAQKVKQLNLDSHEMAILLLFCHKLVNMGEDHIGLRELADIITKRGIYNCLKRMMMEGQTTLQKKKIIEFICVNGIADVRRFKLTEEAKRDLLSEMNISTVEMKPACVKEACEITKKRLFFANDLQRQLNELLNFLRPDNYQQIQQRMRDKGFRNGFACLFYGAPGTGKTEAVYQMAKRTGRDIMVVDVPNIKSKWVGESEKNIKAIFDRYRQQVTNSQLTPILLFNEADAIISMRKNGAENSVDKMENSIQNIILQEMESLEGIMIATTNLQQNMDKAFERRFLYKIKFEKPTLEARAHIWHDMIPELSESEVQMLASKYDFNGGQIENVARKYAIDGILHGDEGATMAMLIAHCDNEHLDYKNARKVGFR